MIQEYKQRILNRSERILRTDVRYLVRGSFWLFIGKGFGIIAGLATSIAFANLLPPDVYGNYRFILSLAAIVSSFTLTGMATAVSRAAARGVEGVLRHGFFTQLKWSIGVAVGAFSLAIYYFVNDNYTLTLSMLIVGSFSPFLESSKLYNAYLIGKKEFRRSVLLGFIRKIVPTVLLIATVYITKNPVIIVFVYFATNTFVMLSLYRSAIAFEPKYTHKDMDMVSYSKHLSLMNIFGAIAGQLDKVLIFHFLGAAPLAVYAFATMPVSQIHSLSEIFRTLLLPKLSTRPISVLRSTLPRKALIFFATILPVVALYMLSAPYIYHFVFPQYMDSVLFSQVFALVLLFLPLGMFGQTFVAHARKRELWVLQTAVPVAKILALLLLLPIYGIWGAIAAMFIQRIVSAFLHMFLFAKIKRQVA